MGLYVYVCVCVEEISLSRLCYRCPRNHHDVYSSYSINGVCVSVCVCACARLSEAGRRVEYVRVRVE